MNAQPLRPSVRNTSQQMMEDTINQSSQHIDSGCVHYCSDRNRYMYLISDLVEQTYNYTRITRMYNPGVL